MTTPSALRSVAGPDLSAAELHALLKLRTDVFIVEQKCPYPEIDGRDLDPTTQHLWWQPAQHPLAYLRVLGAPGTTRRIGRVCTAAAARGNGLGALLMRAALDVVGPDPSELDAQTYAQAFYERFDYTAQGAPYDDDGIMHIHMTRPGPGFGSPVR
ncbi:GNAT family N-acetyltransferase [Actinokineospora pegani]|uniref:GNAT family N-acetyltransferase n=1 Tax=Actinokineospora pegani TaxID=2654637 RepID=UPI001F17D1C5|nr:GNAT family N-acetyltransferase [Actinokineospora pegani]